MENGKWKTDSEKPSQNFTFHKCRVLSGTDIFVMEKMPIRSNMIDDGPDTRQGRRQFAQISSGHYGIVEKKGLSSEFRSTVTTLRKNQCQKAIREPKKAICNHPKSHLEKSLLTAKQRQALVVDPHCRQRHSIAVVVDGIILLIRSALVVDPENPCQQKLDWNQPRPKHHGLQLRSLAPARAKLNASPDAAAKKFWARNDERRLFALS